MAAQKDGIAEGGMIVRHALWRAGAAGHEEDGHGVGRRHCRYGLLVFANAADAAVDAVDDVVDIDAVETIDAIHAIGVVIISILSLSVAGGC